MHPIESAGYYYLLTAAQMNLGNGWVISIHTILDISSLIRARINPC